MDSKLLFALLGFSLLLLGCAGGQLQAPPAQQPSQVNGIELGFDETQSLEDLDAVSGEDAPQQLDGMDLSFNESESIDDIDAAPTP
ncbi:MAG: hypothetical protein Q7T16_05860 [Candidatus Burarchaeum sp.]|nr:hypothetical protein [Candidatus Burarchaeum sp.]MDO8340152.1 hypothetical protein [Candidatus Burarchaeum sp.]